MRRPINSPESASAHVPRAERQKAIFFLMKQQTHFLYKLVDAGREVLDGGLQELKLSAGRTDRVQSWTLTEVPMGTSHHAYILQDALNTHTQIGICSNIALEAFQSCKTKSK